MIKKIENIIKKEQFEPSLLGLFINPFYFARKGLYQQIKSLGNKLSGKVLDVGCGLKPYKKYIKATEYIGLEMDCNKNNKKQNADYFYNGEFIPFESSYFDSIIITQVFEHVFNPDFFLKEINRGLKLGGLMLMTVPFIWDEHEQPFDYARYSSFGLKAILKKYGFEIIKHTKSTDDIRAIFQLINNYIYKKLFTNKPYLNGIITIIFMSPLNIMGEFLSKILPKNEDLYLNNIMLLKKERNV